MSKFNRLRSTVAKRSPVQTERVASGTTYQGGPGFAREAKGELFLLAVANMVAEDTFYEKAEARDERYEQLIAEVAGSDPEWLGRFLGWLRTEANMRSAALVGAMEAAFALVAAGVPGARQIVAEVLRRPDEPGEALAYWIGRHGRSVPQPVKRGIADAATRLYTEFALLKYDTVGKGFRFGDVLELTHPAPATPAQGDLFRVALDRRHARAGISYGDTLPMLAANASLRAETKSNPKVMLQADRLKAAGMTWEDALSLVGSRVDKGRLWTALIPSMGYMALLRNLRNFDQANVSNQVARTVAARLSDPAQVAGSRQFPFRFLAAYRNVPSLRWSEALEQALTLSLGNVPALGGTTLILVDLSGSMQSRATGRYSDLTRADVAKVFGATLAQRSRATLVWFDTASGRVDVPAGGSLLRLIESFPRAGGGTDTAAAVRQWYDRHDRVVIITDEQALDHGDSSVVAAVPARVPVYTWNLAGYRYGHAPSGLGTRHTFGGLTDAAFRLIPLLETKSAAEWPF
jgi:hypothetical protein